MATSENINQIFSILAMDNQNPVTELNYTNNYTLLVAVVLSAQATDVSVNKATNELFARVSTPAQMIELGEEGLKKYIKTIGLYNSKAANVIKLSQQLIERHGGEVPSDFMQLTALAGVGEKTAKVVLNCAFGQGVVAVDTHVFRVARRLGIASSDSPGKVSAELEKNIPSQWLRHAHHWLILHGRYVCKAQKPLCQQCKINQYCKTFLQ